MSGPPSKSVPPQKPEVRCVLGTPLDVTDYARLSEYCWGLAEQPGPVAIEFANTQVVTMRRHEPSYRQLTDRTFDHFVPDGMPLIWCMNRLGANLEDRVYGPTFLRHFISQTNKPFTHFFLGGTESSGAQLVKQIQQWNSGARVVGTYHGVCRPDGTLLDESVIERLNELSPDFIWVGLGTPKQDAFIDRYKHQLRRGVILSVGFAFDVNAGTKRDAPLWMQRRGLTWLFRLATEPRRLGPRYIRYNSLFLFYILREGLQQAPRPATKSLQAEPQPCSVMDSDRKAGQRRVDETGKRQSLKPSVLIVVENLPVPLDRRVWQEARALRDAGYKVVVICPKMRGHTAGEEVLDGIHIYRHWISEEARGFFGFFREYGSALVGELRLAWKAWRRHRFKVIHLCNPPDLLFAISLPFKMLGVRVIYDVHDLWPEMYEAKFHKRGFFYRGVRWAQRLSYATADVVLATNESVRDVSIVAGRKSAEQVFVVRSSPHLLNLSVTHNPELKKKRPFLVGYVGVMGSTDGADYLVHAAAHLVYKIGRKDVQFLLMGSGPEHGRLMELRNELGLEAYIDMPGGVSDEFLFSALSTIDLGVSCDPINSYNNHCTMNKVLEYMVFGKPQVMFDLKEGRASAGEAAVYVPENSAIKLAEAIDSLLNDPGARKRMGQLGAHRIQHELNWEKSVQNLLAAYGQVLK